MLFEIKYFLYKYKVPFVVALLVPLASEFLLQALFPSFGYRAFDRWRYTLDIFLWEYFLEVVWFCLNFRLYRDILFSDALVAFPWRRKWLYFFIYLSNLGVSFSYPVMDMLIRGHINTFERVGIYFIRTKGGGYSESGYVSTDAFFIMLFVSLIVFYRVTLSSEKQIQVYSSDAILQEDIFVRALMKIDVAFSVLLVLDIILTNIAYDRYLQLLFINVYQNQVAVAKQYALYCGASFFFSTMPSLILSYLFSRLSLETVYNKKGVL